MRIAIDQQKFISNYWNIQNGANRTYLFGSRVDDAKKGGDIDIIVLSESKIHHTEIFKMKMEFCSKFGAQKLDIINLEFDNTTEFKKHVLSYAKLLSHE